MRNNKIKSKNFMFRKLSYEIIGVAFKVHSALGAALPERCYREALTYEFIDLGYTYKSERWYTVYYEGSPVGRFRPDLIIQDRIVLELKSEPKIYPHHISQLLAYLTVTGHKVGYILNFGASSLQFKRIIK